MGGAALAAAVPYPGQAAWISCEGQQSILKKYLKKDSAPEGPDAPKRE